MISTLKGNAPCGANKNNDLSPKLLAMSMLVAEFLLNQEHLCTLSVLITEVPMLSNLREFNSYVNHLGNNTHGPPVNKPRFQLNDVQDILEAVGIQPISDIAKCISQYYFHDISNQNLSLLACLFKAITIVRTNDSKYNEVQNNKNNLNKSTKIEIDTYEHRLNNWLVSIEDILNSFNLNEGQRNTLKKLLKNYHQNNNAQEVAVYKERLKKLGMEIKKMTDRVVEVEQLAKHFHSQNTGLLVQKEQMECVTKQLHLETQQLYKLINEFEEKEKSVQNQLKDVENQRHELQLKEIEILKNERLLKEKSIKNIDETNIIDSNQVKMLQEQNINLTKQVQNIQLKLDELKEFKKNEQSSPKIMDYSLQRIESSLDKEMVRKLQRENDELREFIIVQRKRIEELSHRASNLGKLIEKTHQIPSTTTDYQHKSVKKKLQFVEDFGKKNHHAYKNISSTTTDYSTTLPESDNQTEDDIVQGALSKWKTLAVKTAKVKQNLINYQTNSMRDDSDNKIIRVNRQSYNIRSTLSDDSDSSFFKNSGEKINLKDLANKIGYHRSIRRSKNDTSLDMLQNTRSRNYTYISPIKSSSTNTNNVFKVSPINRTISRIESPVSRINYQNEFSTDTFNVPNQSIMESTVINRPLSDSNSPGTSSSNNFMKNKTPDNIEVNNYKSSPNKLVGERYKDNNNLQSLNGTDLPKESQEKGTEITSRQNSLNHNAVDTNFTSKNEQESDHTISFGSNKTDKSSDFWA
ncbi:putative uncharacterized protein DDB_G0290989 isoform X2 [Sipha flava]|nr:putative uncharacterized protein DDB_G0290989 isoform X2 [Sipha flava]